MYNALTQHYFELRKLHIQFQSSGSADQCLCHTDLARKHTIVVRLESSTRVVNSSMYYCYDSI